MVMKGNYYMGTSSLSIGSASIELPTLAGLSVEKIMQTDALFDHGSCEAMIELFVFIFALVLSNENAKQTFIEPIMEFDEEI
jgi:hypothetical protein